MAKHSAFDWHALRAELEGSQFLLSSDDLSTQRGIVAASIAILERAANSEFMRHVSWTAAPVLARRAKASQDRAPAPSASFVPPTPPTAPMDGGSLVSARPMPVMPRPGGNAMAPRDAFVVTF